MGRQVVMVHGRPDYYFVGPFADVGGIGRCEAERAFFQRAIYIRNIDDYCNEWDAIISSFEFAAFTKTAVVATGAQIYYNVVAVAPLAVFLNFCKFNSGD